MLQRTPGYVNVSCSQQITANFEYMTLEVEDDDIEEFSSMSEDIDASDEDWAA
ncbi:hypothetical protein LguiA_009214 [Lonicera macranthoides]